MKINLNRRPLLSFLGCAIAFCICQMVNALGTPGIFFTQVPAYGSSTSLSGAVTGVTTTNFGVAVFIYIPGAGWWSKPTCAQEVTPINPDGTWSTSIVTGGSDQNATRIAALLVSTNYNQPCVLGLANLPATIYSQAIAHAIVTRPSPGVRFLSFSGYDWWVKTGTAVGPGPNNFSDSTNNVWVDTNGWLHVAITKSNTQWQCAEIISARSFGYGSYRFEVNSNIDAVDLNTTLGMFTWSDDPAYTDREIDVEASRWDDSSDTDNTQFVIQPPTNSANLVRYRTPPADIDSTHLFTWQSNQVSWIAVKGAYTPPVAKSNLIRSYTFTTAPAVPQNGDECVHINFWLINGNPPANGQPSAFVIKSFRFVPLASPSPARFTNPKIANGLFQSSVNAQFDWWYALQNSTNLSAWQTLYNLLATNASPQVTIPVAPGAKFYRLLTQP
jgi:hypothetical protein